MPLVLILFLAGGLWAGCQSGRAPASAEEARNPPAVSAEVTQVRRPQGELARESRPRFDGERAFVHLKKQCAFGPRYLGSRGHAECRDYLVTEMKKYADEVVTQDFSYRGMPLSNIAGVFYPAGSEKPAASPVLLLAHWDTRPIADGPNAPENRRGTPYRYGPRGWNRLDPIPGASDGASGVAVLLELARLFHSKKPSVGVVILLVDGEDYGDFQANNRKGEGVFLGSRYFAQHYRRNPVFGNPMYGILLDMVGGKNLLIPREEFSQQYAPGTNERVFRIAQALGYGRIFRWDRSHMVEDDHVPLNEAGIPTIDLLHPLPFGEYATTGYVHWHTLQDVPENCSAQSLQAVGDVVAEAIYSER
ncbi:MAG: M28 family peptidase [Chloroherpetonaceae bacterium]|nr:M28 family peptidase [Chthonomonadaceae bacterium]MDW8207890.1 M28 family peptidase [Chloroherpetonaceae bacterium]